MGSHGTCRRPAGHGGLHSLRLDDPDRPLDTGPDPTLAASGQLLDPAGRGDVLGLVVSSVNLAGDLRQQAEAPHGPPEATTVGGGGADVVTGWDTAPMDAAADENMPRVRVPTRRQLAGAAVGAGIGLVAGLTWPIATEVLGDAIDRGSLVSAEPGATVVGWATATCVAAVVAGIACGWARSLAALVAGLLAVWVGMPFGAQVAGFGEEITGYLQLGYLALIAVPACVSFVAARAVRGAASPRGDRR
jgi:hypothetical protein